MVRSRPPLSSRVIVATLLVSLIGVTGAVADEFERTAEQRARLDAEIDRVTAELDELHARTATVRDEVAGLEQRQRELEAQRREAAAALSDRAREQFMRGGSVTTFESFLNSEGPQIAVERAGMLAALSRRDRAVYESATALRTQIDTTEELLDNKIDQLKGLEAQMEARATELQQQFEQVDADYRELKQIKDRQVEIDRGQQQGTYACIFQGPHRYRNTWGDPRSGGRRHKGTDIFAAYDAPVYAFTDGYVSRMSNSGLGGIGLYLNGDDGVLYYYAHLSGYADDVHVGTRVEAGELVAYNGASGNADRWAPHVHYQVHPGGGAPVNPYPWLLPVCG